MLRIGSLVVGRIDADSTFAKNPAEQCTWHDLHVMLRVKLRMLGLVRFGGI